jgi:uncharacterized protein (DUF2126 family)/transglutaminase-like putative cysteine protease
MIQVAIEHRTTYRFDRPVRLSPHVIRLRPAPHCRTPVLAYSLRVRPEGHFLNWQQDPYGNFQARLVFPEPTTELDVTVDLVADMTVINPFGFFVEPGAETYPFRYDDDLANDLAPYLAVRPPGPLLAAWLAEIREEIGETPVPTSDYLVAMNGRVHRRVAYSTRMEAGVQTPEETLGLGVGSCRDSAWLLVQLLRHFGLASRFVSGYLVQLAADAPPLDGPAGPAADFTDLHAWAEVYVPGAGWLGLDATSGLLAGEGHLPLACTPDPGGAAPVTGTVGPSQVTMEHANLVRRIREDVRVTKPYTEEQWARIQTLGDAVDADLVAGDVRLTLGGEPTFVSADDPDGPEWNITADSERKRELAVALTRRLAGRFAPGALLQDAQGKWYPGEPLPRWQLGVHWRADGEALWTRPELLALPVPGHDEGAATIEQARALAVAIAANLGIPADCCVPAYEDPAHSLWTELSLPPGAPPDAEAQAALAAQLDTGKGEPAGWVVPVHRASGPGAGREGGWGTSRWTTRRGNLFLLPGDSPLGLRLPLSSLAWKVTPGDPPRSPFDRRDPLARTAEAPTRPAPPPARIVPPDEAPPTALCTEVRGGVVRIFLPPLESLEHFIALLGAVEAAVAAGGRAVAIEGYPPPGDPRLRSLGVAPDPGVIEVNVHPASSWRELVTIVTGLYEDATATRLRTDKFALDGLHTGTGGGNHMTLGGPTPADSPLLRRPDLLRSLITYWQHHPSLSYLFSGRFVGPTSQAPRVDEARHDSLDELEIAFAELDRLGAADDAPRPWLVDRLLRHLLVDVTGSTHRTEFCMDKLFSPDGERGRLGLIELRGFEMPPHPRMSLVQTLLVRALIARCWATPYRAPLVRWGTELHDRFLLPWYVAADAADVAADLRAHGYPFDPAWFDPFLEFRFPRLGSVEVAGVGIELRWAIEAWPVLGEEVVAGATARGVDSSMERMQVRVEGMTAGRHVLTCNRVPVPLHPTGTPGMAVAGVRYKAWKPPSGLHPTIGVHTPLVFDLIDTWNGRSLGGCTYHVSDPGGRAQERFPINANEAEARRAGRFQPFGHTPGDVEVALPAATALDQGHPRTLDLRRSRAL